MAISSSISDFRHGRVPRELRERQLVELAEQLFAERGYGGTSMEELASRAGVTKPMVYELFGSKDGVFRACVDRAVEQMARSVAEAVRAEADPESRVRAGGLAFLRFAADDRVAWDLLSMGGQFAQQAVDIRRGQAELIHELMLELAPGSVDERELEAAAWAVTAAYEGLAHWMREHPDVPVERVGDWIVALLMPGLRRFT
ncbi:MAG TPA: TetR/AcrR family transcriptional regulator [Thermoleophilaceae bacterium]|nr:TetR/AcrR family transcriptional regulator [Thermoleophilaceae bacterium]